MGTIHNLNDFRDGKRSGEGDLRIVKRENMPPLPHRHEHPVNRETPQPYALGADLISLRRARKKHLLRFVAHLLRRK